MLLDTEKSKKGLDWLGKVKGNRLAEGLTSFYTKDNNLYAEINSGAGMIYRACLSSNVEEEVEFSLLIQKYISALIGYTVDTYDIEVKGNNINIRGLSNIKASLFGGKGALIIFKDDALGNLKSELEINLDTFLRLMKKYLAFTDKDIPYNGVYVNSSLYVFNRKTFIKNDLEMDLGAPIFFDNDLVFSILNMTKKDEEVKVKLSIYDNYVKITYNDFCIFFNINEQSLKAFDKNITSLPYEVPETSFSLLKDEINSINKSLFYFLREDNNTITLNFKNKTAIVTSDSDVAELPLVIRTTDAYTVKKFNFKTFLNLVDSVPGDQEGYVKINSGLAPEDYFYIVNGTEMNVMSLIRTSET